MTTGTGEDSPVNVTHYLKGIDLPVKKQELVDHAKKNGAPSEVMKMIEAMPDSSYATMADVMKGYKQAE